MTMLMRLPSCATCARYRKPASGKEPTCEAFPEGIPDVILRAENAHTRPYRGDNGLTFVPAFPGAQPADPDALVEGVR